MFDVIIEEKIDLNIYKEYLTEMSAKFYQENYKNLFYVQKEKMTNLYHMVEKCKMKDILKLNWLIKVGFSQESQSIINEEFFYQTVEKCGDCLNKLSYQ